MDQPAAAFDAASRCLLAAADARGPLVVPLAHWFDGAALWSVVHADDAVAAALRAEPRCVAALAGDDARGGVAARADARLYSLADPVRLAVHGPVIAAAMSALAARHAGAIAAVAAGLPRSPPRLLGPQAVVLRLELRDVERLAPAPAPTGVGPALPTALPPEVRRPLSGVRGGVAVWDTPPLRVAATSLGPGFTLSTGGAASPPPGAHAAIVLAAGDEADAVGVALHGRTDHTGALVPDHARWWQGLATHPVDVVPPSSAGVVVPD